LPIFPNRKTDTSLNFATYMPQNPLNNLDFFVSDKNEEATK